MRLPPLLTSLIALLLVVALLTGAWALLTPRGPVLRAAAFSLSAITPNADGDGDVTLLRYNLARPARVSVYFLDGAGNRYAFRDERPRDSGKHEVLFSGIVDPF
ncbi:MAG: hypothetical protein HY784_03815, partial [Chloroflexi bacterium]|nr:hypothetical protein [Chloroflexota bacterium]